MRTRLVFIANEMPNIRDHSGALAARYRPLMVPESFEGREDRELYAKLEAEMPSILNRAIRGYKLLERQRGFSTPESALPLLQDAKDLASPVAAFVSECCKLDPEASTPVDDLWVAWCDWARRNGHNANTKQLLSRNLKTATRYKVRTTQPNDDGVRYRAFSGIRLE